MQRPYATRFGTRSLVLIDAGHGGLDATGTYTTPPKNGKRFDHKDRTLNFHGIEGNSVFYEGVSNRIFARMLATELAILRIPYLPIYDDVADTSLTARTTLANAIHAAYNQNTVLISLHSNASSNGTARGWSAHTSEGVTRSDNFAAHIENATKPLMQAQGFQNRGCRNDAFHMVTRSAMPAVLIETLFFDNLQDAMALNNLTTIKAFCEAYARGVWAYLSQ